jgi:hypothetical protein
VSVSQSEQAFRPPSGPRVAGRPGSPPGVVDGGAHPPNGQQPRSAMATTQITSAPPAPGTSAPRTAGPPPAPRPEGHARPAPAQQAAAVEGPRRVRLTVARIQPWSVLKLSFLLSVALGIGLVTASVVLWSVLDAMGVFTSLNDTLRQIGGDTSQFNIFDYVGLGRVVSLTTFIAAINVIILMALSTLGAVLYNLASSLVGGLHVTLSDD